MKLALWIGVAIVAGTLLVTYDRGGRSVMSFVSSATSGGAGTRHLGYVEGETTLVAPPEAGRLTARPVERGDSVAKGDRLFVVDTTEAEAEVARAAAKLSEFQARHTDLLTGKRAEEQEVVRAQRREVEATLAEAETELKRQSDLVAKNIVSRHSYELTFAEVAGLRARVASLAAKERAGDLAARQPEIEAAAALIEEQKAALARAKNWLAQLMPVAPDPGLIENTFFNVGEWVPAGSPVVSLLPDFRIKLRFFLPEAELSKVRPGVRVRFNCDGCPPDLGATVTYVSPRAEYTPPIIYSQRARAQLVFMVEARPDPAIKHPLQPGLPISVTATSPDDAAGARR